MKFCCFLVFSFTDIFFTLGTHNITEYWDTIEDSLSPFSTNSGDWLTVEIDGVRYVADTSNITKDANLECSTGYFLQDEHDICGIIYLYFFLIAILIIYKYLLTFQEFTYSFICFG